MGWWITVNLPKEQPKFFILKLLFLLISIIVIFIMFWHYFCYNKYIHFNLMEKLKYNSSAYVDLLDNKYLYYPTWILIEGEENLTNNELNIDLSQIDCSDIDFSKNNIIVSFGIRLYIIKRYNDSSHVDAWGVKSDDDTMYVYLTDKEAISKNMLIRPSGIVNSVFDVF